MVKPKVVVVINEDQCQGCGYCVELCSQGCIEITGDKFTAKGYVIPSVVSPERCSACGVCVWMCPDMAIEVYKYQAVLVSSTV